MEYEELPERNRHFLKCVDEYRARVIRTNESAMALRGKLSREGSDPGPQIEELVRRELADHDSWINDRYNEFMSSAKSARTQSR